MQLGLFARVTQSRHSLVYACFHFSERGALWQGFFAGRILLLGVGVLGLITSSCWARQHYLEDLDEAAGRVQVLHMFLLLIGPEGVHLDSEGNTFLATVLA